MDSDYEMDYGFDDLFVDNVDAMFWMKELLWARRCTSIRKQEPAGRRDNILSLKHNDDEKLSTDE